MVVLIALTTIYKGLKRTNLQVNTNWQIKDGNTKENTKELPGHPGIMPSAYSSLCMQEVDLALLSCSLL